MKHLSKSLLFICLFTVILTSCEEEQTDFGADFESSTQAIGVGQYVNFEDASTGAVTEFEWTFEGGEPSTSSDKNPSGILYASAGSYDVTLTVTTDAGTSTETKENFVVVTQLDGGCGQATTVTDIDGNAYSVVTIGTQCWLGENLKTTRFRDGSLIEVVTNDSAWTSKTTPALCSYGNDIANDERPLENFY